MPSEWERASACECVRRGATGFIDVLALTAIATALLGPLEDGSWYERWRLRCYTTPKAAMEMRSAWMEWGKKKNICGRGLFDRVLCKRLHLKILNHR